jgi:hypothetical protein
MFMGIAVPALTGTAIAAAMAPAAATEAPKSLDAMLEGCDRKLKQHILETIFGWLDAHEDAKTGAADPVFAAIEAHKQAMADVQVKVEPIAKVVEPDPDNEDAFAEACDNERETLLEFLLTEPTTIAGALAALEFASSPMFPKLHDRCPCPVLAPAFVNGDGDLARASACWPAMIARHVRRLIETHAMLGTVAFGPTVIKA